MRDLLEIIKLDDLTPLQDFQKFCFSLSEAETHEEFSENIQNLQVQDKRYIGNLQNKIVASSEFYEITKDLTLRSLAAKLMDVELQDIKIIFPFFRIDLPKEFKEEEEKISLPWHQEAGYYLAKGDCTPDSIVMSIALHDCNNENGAIHIGCKMKEEVLQHKSFYMDKNQKKHFRVECAEPKESMIAETKFGQVVAFDFKRPHRSGTNRSNLVRLTLLLRASSKFEVAQFLNH